LKEGEALGSAAKQGLAEVDVGLDEPGEEPAAAAVEHLGVGPIRNGVRRGNGHDTPVFDEERSWFPRVPSRQPHRDGPP
jgi:hypothetical protein